MLVGKVESVTLIEHISSGLDCCKIAIEFDEHYIFGDYNELLMYVDKNVQYDIRKDMYKGAPISVIANIVDNYTVQTLDKSESIRLIPEDHETRVVCNFKIDSLKFGDFSRGCIGFLSSWEKGSSSKTQWIDCTIIDAAAKQFVLRLFTKNIADGVNAYEVVEELVGHYIKFNINYTKYGYQTDELQVYDVPVVAPPEVDTAIAIINNAIKDDEALMDYVTKFDLINRLKSIIDSELGYHLVRIASEICMIDMLNNITNTYNHKTMVRAAIASRGYLLPSKTKFSRPVLNVNKVIKTKLVEDKDLILILDPLCDEEVSSTKRMYMEVSRFVDAVIKERRGINEEKDSKCSIDELRDVYGGLL